MYFENHNGFCLSDKICITYNVLHFLDKNELKIYCFTYNPDAVEPHKVTKFKKQVNNKDDTFWIIFSAMKNKLTDRQQLFDYLNDYIESND